MSILGECPRCGYEKAMFHTVEKVNGKGRFGFECSDCDAMAAVTFEDGLELIDDSEFPIHM